MTASLYKKTLSANVDETITCTPDITDAFGGQVIDIEFKDAQGQTVTPTGGTLSIETSPNGRDWERFHSALSPISAAAPVGDWQTSGFVHSMRVVPTGVAGADTWEVRFRAHTRGYNFPHHTIAPLRFFDRIRTVNQTLLETGTLEGDSFRIYAMLGSKGGTGGQALTDQGDSFPAIPGNSSAWFVVQYSSTKLTALVTRVLALFAGQGLKYTASLPGTPFTMDEGSPVTVRALENNLPNDAAVQMRYLGTTTPTQRAGGTEIDFAIVPSDGGGGGSSGGGRLPENQFVIPGIGSQTLIRLYNPSNNSVEVRFEIQILETGV